MIYHPSDLSHHNANECRPCLDRLSFNLSLCNIGLHNEIKVGAPCTRVLSMSGMAVVGVQSEQEGAEHTALEGSSVEH